MSNKESTGFLDKFSNAFSKKEEQPVNEDEESSGLIGKYAGKLKDSLASNIILNKSKSLVQSSTESVQTSINMAKNLPYIIVLGCAGALFLFIAMMYMPVVILYPSKFSSSIAMASVCFLGIIALLKGPMVLVGQLLSAEKLKYTAAYVVSIIGTFYFSMAKNWTASLFFCAFQVVSVAWLIASSIPGGLTIMALLKSGLSKCCGGCAKMLFKRSQEKSFLPI